MEVARNLEERKIPSMLKTQLLSLSTPKLYSFEFAFEVRQPIVSPPTFSAVGV